MKYLFGPVNSRRLGISLGVDLVPFKTCTLDCVYCECGRTTGQTEAIREYVPTDEVIGELNAYLSGGPRLDVITFSGAGEPTLHGGIGRIIDFLKEHFPAYRVAVLTNGTLLSLPDVRRSLLRADVIIPSLDAVSEEAFVKIGRPLRDITPARLVDGLKALRGEFRGKIFVEIFLIPGVNTGAGELALLKKACLNIRPDGIQLNSLDRPGTEEWVRSASRRELEEAKAFFSPLPVEIVGRPREDMDFRATRDDAIPSILATLERRPSTLADLSLATGMEADGLSVLIRDLLKKNLIEEREQERGTFYMLKKTS